MEVHKNRVVTFEYELRVDKKRVAASPEGGSIAVLVGHAHWLPPGLEEMLVGRGPGPFEVIVPPECGVGEHAREKVNVVGRGEFPADASLEVGEEFHAWDESGKLVAVRVVTVEADRVTVDANPELAGKELVYWGEIRAVREARPEETEHGHVHGAGGVEH